MLGKGRPGKLRSTRHQARHEFNLEKAEIRVNNRMANRKPGIPSLLFGQSIGARAQNVLESIQSIQSYQLIGAIDLPCKDT